MRNWLSNKKVFYVSASGGLTMYWAIIIGIIVMSGYLVGGLIPKRFVLTTAGQPMSYVPPFFRGARPALQMGSMNVGGCRGLPAVLFLIDTSESMKRNELGTNSRKIDIVKSALLKFTSQLTDQAMVGITTYSDSTGSNPREQFFLQNLGENREKLHNALSEIDAGGLTYFLDGMVSMKKTLERAKREYPSFDYNVVIIADGFPETTVCNADPGSPTCLCKSGRCTFAKDQDPTGSPNVAKEIRDMGVHVYTIGIRGLTTDDILYNAEYEKMLADTASTPRERHFTMTSSVNNLNDIMGRMGNSLCLDDANAPPLATPTPSI